MSFAGPRPHFSPLETSSSSITPFRTQVHCDDSIQVLRRKRHEYADTVLQRVVALRVRLTSCGMCGEPISSSPSATNTRFTGIFFPAPRIACKAARNAASGPFWFTAPRPIITFPSGGLSTIRASVGGDDHSDWIELFHIVHEIEPDGFRRTCIERREYARLAICVDYRRVLKSCIARELRHVLRALRISTVLCRDRNLPNPILQPLHRLIVPLRDFRFDIGVFSFGEQSVVNCCDKRSAQKQMTKDFHEEYFCAVADCGQVLHRTPVEFS